MSRRSIYVCSRNDALRIVEYFRTCYRATPDGFAPADCAEHIADLLRKLGAPRSHRQTLAFCIQAHADALESIYCAQVADHLNAI